MAKPNISHIFFCSTRFIL